MAVKCPSCGTENQGGKFCAQCGSPLPQSIPAPGAPLAASPVPPNSVPPMPPAGHGVPQPPQAPYGQPGVPQPPQAPYGQPGGPQPPQAPYGQPGAPQPPQAPYGQPGVPRPPQAPYGQPGAPYTPPGMPPMPAPARSGGSRWWIWLVGGLVVGLIAAVAILMLTPDDTPVAKNTPSSPSTPSTPSNPSTPTKPTTPSTPAKPQAGFTLTKAAQGTFGKGYDRFTVSDRFIGVATDEEAMLFEVDAKGQAKPVAQVIDPDNGQLQDVALGMMGNGGATVMLATYENKVHILSETGESDSFGNEDGVYQILVGDYDADGKRETIFLSQGEDGKYNFNAFRYAPGQTNSAEIYSRAGRTTAWPQLWQVEQRVNNKDYLYGYVENGGNYKLIRYKWDGALGPTAVNEYPIANQPGNDLYWLGAGFTPLGPTLLAGRAGQETTIELLTTNIGDFTKVTSLGTVSVGNVGKPSLLIGKFMASDYQIMVVNDKGAYTIYNVARSK